MSFPFNFPSTSYSVNGTNFFLSIWELCCLLFSVLDHDWFTIITWYRYPPWNTQLKLWIVQNKIYWSLIPSLPAGAHSHPSSYPPISLHPTSLYPLYILTFCPYLPTPSLCPLFPSFLHASSMPVIGSRPPVVLLIYPYQVPILEGGANYTRKKSVHVRRIIQTSWSLWILGHTQARAWLNSKDRKGIMPLRTVLEHIIDDDKLSDKCYVRGWMGEHWYVHSMCILSAIAKYLLVTRWYPSAASTVTSDKEWCLLWARAQVQVAVHPPHGHVQWVSASVWWAFVPSEHWRKRSDCVVGIQSFSQC